MTTETTPETLTDPRLLVLHVLRLGGFVAPAAVAERTGLTPDVVEGVLTAEAAAGLVVERTGRIAGWQLTKPGRAAHAELLAAELEHRGARSAVETADGSFGVLNERFKQLCTRWQVRPDGTPNDHTDTGYDAEVVADLAPVHDDVVALTGRLAEVLPRFDRYPRAFGAALDRLRAGETRAFAAPLSESYHDVWMELHQDLMSTLGRERSAADGH